MVMCNFHNEHFHLCASQIFIFALLLIKEISPAVIDREKCLPAEVFNTDEEPAQRIMDLAAVEKYQLEKEQNNEMDSVSPISQKQYVKHKSESIGSADIPEKKMVPSKRDILRKKNNQRAKSSVKRNKNLNSSDRSRDYCLSDEKHYCSELKNKSNITKQNSGKPTFQNTKCGIRRRHVQSVGSSLNEIAKKLIPFVPVMDNVDNNNLLISERVLSDNDKKTKGPTDQFKDLLQNIKEWLKKQEKNTHKKDSLQVKKDKTQQMDQNNDIKKELKHSNVQISDNKSEKGGNNEKTKADLSVLLLKNNNTITNKLNVLNTVRKIRGIPNKNFKTPTNSVLLLSPRLPEDLILDEIIKSEMPYSDITKLSNAEVGDVENEKYSESDEDNSNENKKNIENINLSGVYILSNAESLDEISDHNSQNDIGDDEGNDNILFQNEMKEDDQIPSENGKMKEDETKHQIKKINLLTEEEEDSEKPNLFKISHIKNEEMVPVDFIKEKKSPDETKRASADVTENIENENKLNNKFLNEILSQADIQNRHPRDISKIYQPDSEYIDEENLFTQLLSATLHVIQPLIDEILLKENPEDSSEINHSIINYSRKIREVEEQNDISKKGKYAEKNVKIIKSIPEIQPNFDETEGKDDLDNSSKTEIEEDMNETNEPNQSKKPIKKETMNNIQDGVEHRLLKMLDLIYRKLEERKETYEDKINLTNWNKYYQFTPSQPKPKEDNFIYLLPTINKYLEMKHNQILGSVHWNQENEDVQHERRSSELLEIVEHMLKSLNYRQNDNDTPHQLDIENQNLMSRIEIPPNYHYSLLRKRDVSEDTDSHEFSKENQNILSRADTNESRNKRSPEEVLIENPLDGTCSVSSTTPKCSLNFFTVSNPDEVRLFTDT